MHWLRPEWVGILQPRSELRANARHGGLGNLKMTRESCRDGIKVSAQIVTPWMLSSEFKRFNAMVTLYIFVKKVCYYFEKATQLKT